MLLRMDAYLHAAQALNSERRHDVVRMEERDFGSTYSCSSGHGDVSF